MAQWNSGGTILNHLTTLFSGSEAFKRNPASNQNEFGSGQP